MPRKRARLLSAAVAATLAATAPPRFARAIVAFPGAEGFGANAVGGRNGDVYHVTTLADDPTHVIPGSFFYGLYEKNVPGSGTVAGNGRTIVFDVGGTINIGTTTATLDIKNIKNVTIAGQTAPSPITIIGNLTQITSSSTKETGNIIVQYLTFRKGTGNGDDAFHVQGNGDTHDIMIDHVSGSWSEDEVISATQNARNLTVQNSIMSEALTSDHAFGSLIRPQINTQISFNRNLYSNQKSRNPRPGTYDGMTLDFEFQNNVIYNWSDRAGYIAGADGIVQHLNMNYVGNYLIAGPAAVDNSGNPTRRETAFLKENNASPLDLHFYQAGNKIDSNATPARDGTDTGWGMFQQSNAGAYSAFPDADKVASRFPYPASTPDSADDAYGKAIASVGAFPYARSAVDQRLINDVINYTGTAPITAPDATEWNNIINAPTKTRPAGWDTDRDGMPNDWETTHGFNPAGDDHTVLAADGYSRLEHYLQSLTLIANWNLDGNGNWSQFLNWRGTLPRASDATANFVAGTSAPRTIVVDMPVSLGQLSFAGGNGYTLAGASPITIDVFAGKASIVVTGGSHTIAAPLVLIDNTDVTVAPGGTLTLSNLQPSAATITKLDLGELRVNNIRAALVLSGGYVRVLPDGSSAGVSRINALSLAPAAKLDLTNNRLITQTSVAAVTGLLQSAYTGGNWDGNGIITSQSAATVSHLTSIGVATASQVTGIAAGATTTWSGQTVTGSDTLVMYTYAGDATMDGKINVDDYGRIDFNAALGVSGWFNGDFNYDGKINVDDYGIIDFNIGIQGPPLVATAPAAGLATVPEPATTMVLAVAVSLGLPRLRRRS